MSVVDKIKHYQRNIEKSDDNEDRILHCISKLSNLPVTVQHLQETGVGRTVNALRKYDGGIGDAAKALVAKWKAMVANEETSDGEDEDEACVPDVPESYNDNSESPKLEDTCLRRKSEETKHTHRHKIEKNEISSTAHSSKQISKHESKSKTDENQYKNDSDMKSSNSELEKQMKHEKSKHSHKHQSRSDKKSSSREIKDNKSASKKDETDSYKHQNRSKPESLEKSSNRNSDSSKLSKSSEENHKKRKSEYTEKKESKRRKNSEHESDDGKLQVSSSSEKQNVNMTFNAVKVKEEPKDKDTLNKTEVKCEKKDAQEKLKSSSTKHKMDASCSKSKDAEEKQKRKHEVRPNTKKDETRRDDSHHSNKEHSESKSHSSSSSNKHCDKSKDKSNKKDHKEGKQKYGNKSSGDPKDPKNKSKESKETIKIKQEINGDEGIDCNSGASFAEALGMCTMAQPSRKRNSPNSGPAKVTKPEPPSTENKKLPALKIEAASSDNLQQPALLGSNVKLEPLSVDLASTLPEISPNYKPLPYINPIHRKEEDKTLTDVIYVKNQRTKVYSGNKSGYTTVPSLYEICIRILIENIDALEFTGGVPYDIIKPVMERASADQLFMLEHYNPYLIEDTDGLWQFHCNREFRNKQREEMETWREMYMRCLDEREAKLKTLTANIKQSIDKSVPLRSTKLAYVDNVVKPPRNVLKKQAKYGTANSVPTTSNLKKKLIAGGGPNSATSISVPPPPMPRIKASTGIVKKTKAPLMAKALQLIKGRYKR